MHDPAHMLRYKSIKTLQFKYEMCRVFLAQNASYYWILALSTSALPAQNGSTRLLRRHLAATRAFVSLTSVGANVVPMSGLHPVAPSGGRRRKSGSTCTYGERVCGRRGERGQTCTSEETGRSKRAKPNLGRATAKVTTFSLRSHWLWRGFLSKACDNVFTVRARSAYPYVMCATLP